MRSIRHPPARPARRTQPVVLLLVARGGIGRKATKPTRLASFGHGITHMILPEQGRCQICCRHFLSAAKYFCLLQNFRRLNERRIFLQSTTG